MIMDFYNRHVHDKDSKELSVIKKHDQACSGQ
jgi:hypothetical protein